MKKCNKCARIYDDTWSVCLYCSALLKKSGKRKGVKKFEDPGKIISFGPNKKMYEKRLSAGMNEKKVVPFECPICRGELEIEVDFRCIGDSGIMNLDTICPLCSATLKGSLSTTED